MQKREIDELLKRHSAISPLDRCGFHWVPAGKSVDWYLGFLPALEICEGVRQLFTEEKQPEAYEILGKRLREELQKFAKNEGEEVTPNSSPLTPADEQYLQETLIDCRVKLESALKTAQGYRYLPDLTESVADALTGVRDAIAVLSNPQTYIKWQRSNCKPRES